MTLYFISFFKSIYIYIIHYVIYIYNIYIYIYTYYIILYYIRIYILRYITHITVWYVYFDIGSPSAWECLNGLLRANLGIWSCTFQTAHLDLVAAFDVSLSADKPRGSNKCNFTIHWWNVTINWGKFHHQLVELACILMRMSSKTFYKPKRVGVQLTLNILELWFNVVNGTFHVASIHGFIPYSPSCGPDKANGIWRGSVEHVGIFHSNDSLHLEAWRTAKNQWFRDVPMKTNTSSRRFWKNIWLQGVAPCTSRSLLRVFSRPWRLKMIPDAPDTKMKSVPACWQAWRSTRLYTSTSTTSLAMLIGWAQTVLQNNHPIQVYPSVRSLWSLYTHPVPANTVNKCKP